MTAYKGTIDWDEYWATGREASTDYPANVGRHGKADLLARFVEAVGVPDDLAAVGCGPANCPVEVAERYPGMEVYGYDAAESVVRDDRERVDRGNVTFEVAALPDLDAVDRAFDLAYCYATLHYVRDVERAIRNLYDRVRSGGHLVVNYPNEATRETYRGEFADDEEFRERFGLVFEGANLTSAGEIADLLDAEVRDYWDAVGTDADFATPANPCVAVEK